MFVPFDQSKIDDLSSSQLVAIRKENADKEILALNKVNVAQFTRVKCIADLKEFFEWFCPQIKDWDINYSEVEVSHEFQPMRKKNIPKNVVKVALLYNVNKISSVYSFSVYFSYLLDGRINLADANLWKNRRSIHLKIRLKKDELYITEIKTSDMEKEESTVAFKNNSPVDNVESSLILDKCWSDVMSHKQGA